MTSLTKSIRALVKAFALRHLDPKNAWYCELFAIEWASVRRQYPGLRSGRIEAVVREHGLARAAALRTGEMRRAARDAADRASRIAVAEMIAALPTPPRVPSDMCGEGWSERLAARARSLPYVYAAHAGHDAVTVRPGAR